MRKTVFVLLCVTAVCMLFGCEKKREYINTQHDETIAHVGETVKLELTNIPEGYTSAQYKWNSHNASEKAVDEHGNFTADAGGVFYVYADLYLEDKTYCEEFIINVPAYVENLSLDQSEIELLPNLSEELTALAEGDCSPGKFDRWNVEWSSSNETVAVVKSQSVSFPTTRNDVVALAPGEAVVSVTMGGKTVSCSVTVHKADIETYRYLCEQGKNEFLNSHLFTLLADNYAGVRGDKEGKWSKDAPAEIKEAYAYPVDLFLELYGGQETMLATETWKMLYKLDLLPSDELDRSINRIRSAAGVYSVPYDDANDAATYYDPFDWQNAMNAAQYAALGAEQGGRAIIMWTGEEAFEPYIGRQFAPDFTKALFDDEIAAVADCGLTALLPEPLLPERLEDVEYVIELRISGVPDDTNYYYSDTKELADDLTVIKTRVTCLVWQVRDGEWTQVYDAGYAEGDLPGSYPYTAKVVVGDHPSNEQIGLLISDAVKHIPE